MTPHRLLAWAAGLLAATASQAQGDVGAALYAQHCAACHQADGSGVPGSFPPLRAGHVPRLLAEGGRYPARVLLQGVTGRLDVGSDSYNGVMPGFAHLADADIAALVQHLGRWNGVDVAITPQAVGELRAQPPKQKVRELRAVLMGRSELGR